MLRNLFVTLIGASLVILSGCVLTSMFGGQTWSENYALIPGVQATSPAMVDGDLKTVGQTALPEGSEDAYGISGTQEAMITLPEVKNIYRIIVHSDNIKTLKVLADKGDGDWDLIEDIKAIKNYPIDMRVSTRTDKIRIRVLATTDDGNLRRARSARGNWDNRWRGSRVAPGKIAEVEIYGYASGEAIAQMEQSAQEENLLDELLAK